MHTIIHNKIADTIHVAIYVVSAKFKDFQTDNADSVKLFGLGKITR